MQAVDYEDQHNTKLGAEVCEHVLEVTEKILQEASSNRPVLSRSLSQPVRANVAFSQTNQQSTFMSLKCLSNFMVLRKQQTKENANAHQNRTVKNAEQDSYPHRVSLGGI